MSLFVLDTDILSLFQRGHPVVTRRCGSHPPGELAITVISVEEQISGWYAVLRKAKQPEELTLAHQSLIDSVRFLATLRLLPFPLEAIARYHLPREPAGLAVMTLGERERRFTSDLNQK